MSEQTPSHPSQSETEHPVQPESATDLSEKLAKLQAQLKEQEQKYIYLYADFENFKKRTQKERQDLIKFGWEPVASELLPVLDNFERALQYAKPETDPNLISGLQMVASQFKTALEKQGVQLVKSIDQTFNPEFHEAVGELPSPKPQGIIVQEHLKGYTLHGRLLRPSRVMVSRGGGDTSNETVNGSGPGQN